MQLPLPITIATNQAVNKILALDPERSEKLSQISGRVVRIDVLGAGLEVYILFQVDSVEIMNFFDGEIDLVVSGTPFALASLYQSNNAIFEGSVSITGDVDTGKQFKKLLSDFDVDWEEQLATLSGDAVAHRVFRAGRDLQSLFAGGLRNIGLDTAEYLQEEILVVAVNSEVDHFCADVDDLRSSVDRFEAKLQQLENYTSDRGGIVADTFAANVCAGPGDAPQ